MLKLETVKLADVFPLEDEYGNKITSRDYSLEENEAYVEELAESMRADGGVPREPVTLVRDGGVYRIKSGNSRVRAMKSLGTEECVALVDDDETVQSALETVLLTDTKKRYEAVERSRYVQQLTMFGDDEYVSGIAGIEKEKVQKVRRAKKAVKDGAEEMTLDRMYAIAEFADDPEAVEELSACQERDVSWKASQLRAKREAEKARAEYRAAFAALGVPVTEGRGDVEGMGYYISVKEPGDAAASMPPEWDEGQVMAVLVSAYSGVRAEVYVDPELGEEGESEEEAELRRQEEAYEEAIGAMDGARIEWFWANLAQGKPMPNLLRECEAAFFDNWQVAGAVKAMYEDAEAAARNKGLSLFDYAMGSTAIRTDGTRFAHYLAFGMQERMKGSLAAYLDELVFYQADGWDPGDARAIIAKLSQIVEGDGDE